MEVAFHTLGCRLNQSETAILSQSFVEAGHRVVQPEHQADICVINTCTVTGFSDAKCRNSIRKLIRKNPGARVAVIGCYAESGFQSISEIDGVDVVVGNQEKLNLLKYLPEEKLESPRIVRDKIAKENFTIEAIGQSTCRARTSLKIQDGCNFMCSFCIIPFVRGRARSRVYDNLIEEAKVLLDSGFKELVLTGVNIGTFEDEGRSLTEVVDGLQDLGCPRVRISSIEPTTLGNGLYERMSDDSHCLVPYLHLPLQSGSDRILELMHRRYSRQEYLEECYRAQEQVPGITIGTDVLLGYPAETEADFQETYELIAKGPIDYAHAFTYSERSGTPASKEKQLPVDVRRERTNAIRKLSSQKKMECGGRYLGQTLKVLFEEHEEGYWQGYSENYVLVKVNSNLELGNCIADVHIKEVCGEWVLGELLADNLTSIT